MTSALSIVTLNILDDLLLWRERAPLIVAELADRRPDVVALQEVSVADPHGRLDGAPSSAHWLADRLGGYEVFLTPGTSHPASDSLAVLTSIPVEAHEELTFAAQERRAQRLDLYHKGSRWHVVNTHLYWNPINDVPRVEQAGQLLDWIPSNAPAVICGDFNASPGSRTLRAFWPRFTSAHRLKHGEDPLLTYPTSLRRGPGVRHWSRHAVLQAHGIARLGKNLRYGGTVDYILVDGSVDVREAGVVFNQPSPDDAGIFPSDHLGLYAELAQPVC